MLTPLRFLRLGKEIKLIDLAKKAKISPSVLSKIETGKLRGSRHTRQKICKVLGVQEKSLFGKQK